MTKCTNCGAPNPPTRSTCYNCGTSLPLMVASPRVQRASNAVAVASTLPLNPGERLLFMTTLSWPCVAFACAVPATALGLAVGPIVAMLVGDSLGTASAMPFAMLLTVAAFGLVGTLGGMLSWTQSYAKAMGVTNSRIILVQGLLVPKFIVYRLQEVESVEVTTPLLYLPFGCGCIRLTGSGGTRIALGPIPRANEVARYLRPT